jgi:diacylglycerol kinase (ATP)
MTVEPRPPLVVINPRAARLHDPARRARVRRAVEAAVARRVGGISPEIVDDDHETALAALRDPVGRPLVVAVGGDGTVRDVAAALAGSGVPMAVVPAGTGNVLAGALRIGGVDRALATIRSGSLRALDLGMARWAEGPDAAVHERHFVVACGMGFDARIMAAAEHEWKRRMRFGAYIGAAVREAVRLRPARFRIRADGKEIDITGLVVLVANCGDLVPGRLGARQPLDPTDGRLDLIVVGGRSRLDGLRGAAALLWHVGEQDGTVIRRAVSGVRIVAEPAQPIETDGDPHPPGWLEASVLPGALQVLAPGDRPEALDVRPDVL